MEPLSGNNSLADPTLPTKKRMRASDEADRDGEHLEPALERLEKIVHETRELLPKFIEEKAFDPKRVKPAESSMNCPHASLIKRINFLKGEIAAFKSQAPAPLPQAQVQISFRQDAGQILAENKLKTLIENVLKVERLAAATDFGITYNMWMNWILEDSKFVEKHRHLIVTETLKKEADTYLPIIRRLFMYPEITFKPCERLLQRFATKTPVFDITVMRFLGYYQQKKPVFSPDAFLSAYASAASSVAKPQRPFHAFNEYRKKNMTQLIVRVKNHLSPPQYFKAHLDSFADFNESPTFESLNPDSFRILNTAEAWYIINSYTLSSEEQTSIHKAANELEAAAIKVFCSLDSKNCEEDLMQALELSKKLIQSTDKPGRKDLLKNRYIIMVQLLYSLAKCKNMSTFNGLSYELEFSSEFQPFTTFLKAIFKLPSDLFLKSPSIFVFHHLWCSWILRCVPTHLLPSSLSDLPVELDLESWKKAKSMPFKVILKAPECPDMTMTRMLKWSFESEETLIFSIALHNLQERLLKDNIYAANLIHAYSPIYKSPAFLKYCQASLSQETFKEITQFIGI